jgi:hypothetical protein
MFQQSLSPDRKEDGLFLFAGLGFPSLPICRSFGDWWKASMEGSANIGAFIRPKEKGWSPGESYKASMIAYCAA